MFLLQLLNPYQTMDVIAYPCAEFSLSMFVKGGDHFKRTLIARFMGPTITIFLPVGPRWAPCWPMNFAIWVYSGTKKMVIVSELSMDNIQWDDINPLRDKFVRGNKNVYLRFMSSFHIDMTKVVEIFRQVRQEFTYFTWSISRVLMSWRHKKPGHQQPWYSPCWTEFGSRTLRVKGESPWI